MERISQSTYVGAITAIEYSPDYEYAVYGSGACITIIRTKDNATLISQNVLNHNKIHGIRFFNQYLIVFGQKSYCILLWSEEVLDKKDNLSIISCCSDFEDWIWDILIDQAYYNEETQKYEKLSLIIGTAHNNIIYWDCIHRIRTNAIYGINRCILYSLSLFRTKDDIYVASGTVFNSVLIWSVKNPSQLITLKHHTGVIFKVRWSLYGDYLLSVSDDRTVCLYKYNLSSSTSFNNNKELNEENTIILSKDSYSLLWKSYGHMNRLWDCIFTNKYIVTCSEDCTLRVWNINGECIMIFGGHKGKHIWSIAYNPIHDIVLSGGNDGSLKVWYLGNIDSSNSTIESECILPTLQGKEKEYNWRDSKSECIRGTGISEDGQYIYVASNWGYIWSYQVNTQEWKELYKPFLDINKGNSILDITKHEEENDNNRDNNIDNNSESSKEFISESNIDNNSNSSKEFISESNKNNNSNSSKEFISESNQQIISESNKESISESSKESISESSPQMIGESSLYSSNDTYIFDSNPTSPTCISITPLTTPLITPPSTPIPAVNPKEQITKSHFSIMVPSPKDDYIISGDIYGNITLISLKNNNYIPKTWKYTDQRILNFIWVSIHKEDSNFYIVFPITSETTIYGWIINKDIDKIKLACVLSLSIRSCITSIYYINEYEYLLCGDSNGGLHLFNKQFDMNDSLFTLDFSHSSVISINTSLLLNLPILNALSICRKAHNHSPITCILYYDSILYTCGCDGKIVTYTLDIENNILTKAITNKVGRMKQISKIWYSDTNTLCAAGFRENEFIIYDITSGYEVLSHVCGGWKRPWSVWTNPIHPLWGILFCSATTNGYERLSIFKKEISQSSNIIQPVLRCPFHGQEIYTCKWLAHINNNEYLIVTGGEDTTLKLSKVVYRDGKLFDIECLHTLEGHSTTVRSVSSCKCAHENNSLYLFSVGGKNSVFIWKIHWEAEEQKDVVVSCSLLYSFPSQRIWMEKEEGEYQRYFSVDSWTMNVEKEGQNNTLYMISCCNSNGYLSLFCFHDTINQLEYVYTVLLSPLPCLTVRHIELKHKKEAHILMVGNTSGDLIYLDITEDIEHYIQSYQTRQIKDVYTISQIIPKPFSIHYSYIEKHIHKCGLNSLIVCPINETQFVVCSVGDDQSLSFIQYQYFEETYSVKVIQKKYFNEVSGSSLRSITIHNNIIAFVGWEQTIELYTLCVDSNSVAMIKKVTSINSQVPEPNCIDLVFDHELNTYFACITGESGFELQVIDTLSN
ncbi:hypothetical protein WA158_007217 [Blastocystis sp. Blastoise]